MTWNDYMKQHGEEEYDAWERATAPLTERIGELTEALGEAKRALVNAERGIRIFLYRSKPAGGYLAIQRDTSDKHDLSMVEMAAQALEGATAAIVTINTVLTPK